MHSAIFRLAPILLLACFAIGDASARGPGMVRAPDIAAAALPAEARDTLVLIRRGGPFPYRKDGVAFQNREKRLPPAPAGFYREYTVPTPDARDRGPRRIIASESGEFYYTDDHYRSFRRIRE